MKGNIDASIVFISLALESVNETVEMKLSDMKDYIDGNSGKRNVENFRKRLENEEQETKRLKQRQQNVYNEIVKLKKTVTDIRSVLQENVTKEIDSKIDDCKKIINEHKVRANKRMSDLENQTRANKDMLETLLINKKGTNMSSTGIKSQNETIQVQNPNIMYSRGKLYFLKKHN